MIKEIMRDETFLAQKAEPATRSDLPAAQDLLDTLTANKERCVGMVANMIGINKRIYHVGEERYQCDTGEQNSRGRVCKRQTG